MKFSAPLKLNHIFRRLYASEGYANGYLVLYARRNRTGGNRLGITVSKKLGHAVVRNRVRRRLREIYRLHEDRISTGLDIVVVARVKAAHADYWQLDASFVRLCTKLGIWKKEAAEAER